MICAASVILGRLEDWGVVSEGDSEVEAGGSVGIFVNQALLGSSGEGGPVWEEGGVVVILGGGGGWELLESTRLTVGWELSLEGIDCYSLGWLAYEGVSR